MSMDLVRANEPLHGAKVLIISVRYLARYGLKEWEFEVQHDGHTRKVKGFIETFRLFKYAGYPITESTKTRHFMPALKGVTEIDEKRGELRIKAIHHSGKVYLEQDAPIRGQVPPKPSVVENVPSTPLAPVSSTLPDDLATQIVMLHELAGKVFSELDARNKQNPSWGKSLIAAQIYQLSKTLLPKGD